MPKSIHPIHPGEILEEEFLVPNGISHYRAAKDLNVPAPRIHEIVHGTRSLTADTALRLAHYFGTSAQFWMNLQSNYDLECREEALDGTIEEEVKVFG